MGDKRDFLSTFHNVTTLFTRHAWAGQVLRLRLGLTVRLTNAFRLGSAQDDRLEKKNL
jgi:hypothetical protein